ncbi:MAG: ATP-binding protein, partial [Armatimonadota bacterium]|nr:ATP-binding protein [Armatimonadota bacterium]
IIPTDPARARNLTVEFADFLRHALRQHGEFCTLAEELWYVEQYLAFERVRLQDRLEVRQQIDPKTLDTILPVLTIQPLVENAILHGIEPKQGKGRIFITSERRGEEDWITVEDDGVGIPKEKLDQIFERGVGSGIGIGLFNVNRRLRAIYGDGYGVILTSQEGEGTRVTVRIPRRAGPHEQSPGARRR